MSASANSKLKKGATGEWEVVIGMEVHAQVTSNAKLFSGASTEFGGAPNSHVSLVDAAMPGMLPVINEECVRQAIRTGLGLNAEINPKSVFERKNYFYPDLPQGYQISQYKAPLVGEGEVAVELADGETIAVGIERLHLEQDAGKSLHDQHPTLSFVDLNRSGVALMEIVSKPDLRSAEEAMAYLRKLRDILRWLGTCDGDMEKGNLRADVNVSVRRPGEGLGTRCEIKNVNSFRFVGQAIDYEARRQIGVIEDGGAIEQETRLFDPVKGETRSMRNKEEAHDYRYFPDPDLLPLELTPAEIDGIKAQLPETREVKRARFAREYGLDEYRVDILVRERVLADYYEAMVKAGAKPVDAANWLINEYLARADEEGRVAGLIGPPPSVVMWPSVGPTGPAANAMIVQMISSREITQQGAKQLLRVVIRQGPTNDPNVVRAAAEAHGLKRISELKVIEDAVDNFIASYPDKAAQAKAKPAAAGWFVGQVMRATEGHADPRIVNEVVKRKLGI
jgi:aspartyl-tRNA(Asn)/glutamyl-tRNA(Gln) amidotransferase subunit B